MKDFNVSYNQATTLVRTESSAMFNKANEDSYKKAGVSKVKFLAEKDACHLCKVHDGKTFDIKAKPSIPVHPNCKCTYLPVIE